MYSAEWQGWQKIVLIRAAPSQPVCEIQHASCSPDGSMILRPGLNMENGKEFKLLIDHDFAT
jgi:hypothetical protein